MLYTSIWNLFNFFDAPLIVATDKCQVEIVKLLLEQEGIDVNTKNVY